MEASMQTWLEKRGGRVLMEDMKEFEDGKDGDEAETGGRNVGIGVRREGDWTGGVVVIVIGRPSEAGAVEGVVDISS